MAGPQMQERNVEQVRLLSADLQPRYEPNFAWKSAISQYQALTSLRGLWPMSSTGEIGGVLDFSQQERTLSNNNTALFNYVGLAPYADLDGANQSFDRPDELGLDITGIETHIAVAIQGLTIGLWFRADTLPGNTSYEGLMTKWLEAGNQRAYGLWVYADGAGDASAVFRVSNDGTAVTLISSTAGTVAATTWYFVAGRFSNDDNELTLWLNDENGALQDYTVAFNNTIVPTGADFYVGCDDGPLNYYDGRVSLCFLAAAALSDGIVHSLYHQSRAMFGA